MAAGLSSFVQYIMWTLTEMQHVCTYCKVKWLDKFYGGYFCVMENHIEEKK